MSNLEALVGQILFAWLPDDQKPHHPGAKFRPVLVVDFDAERKQLLLAYGTSQHIERSGRGQITVPAEMVEGLSKDTKFCFLNMKWVDLSPEYFAANKKEGFSIVGPFPRKLMGVLQMRLKEAL